MTEKKQRQKRAQPKVSAEVLDALLESAQKDGLFGEGGVLEALKGALMQRMLEAEMTDHLGYEKHDESDSENARNGYSPKTVQTESGPTTIQVPRDREGSFEPRLVPKHARRLEGFDAKVLSLYSRGMPTREIQMHLRELYGTDISPDLISSVTDAVIDELHAWQSRPLEAVYPVMYLDALFVSVRENGLAQKRPVYIALGVNMEGQREVLGMWMQETEGARFWLGLLTDLRNRGMQDVFFVACDGLTGFPEAIRTAFPKAVVQTCIVHMIRASLRYVGFKEKKAVVTGLRAIYGADTLQAAEEALDAFEVAWGAHFPTVVKMWRTRWEEVIPFLAFPKDVRTILYTTNAIESVNAQLRKVLRAKGSFPTDQSVLKLLFLALRNAQIRWKASPNWNRAMSHFHVMFEDRFPAGA